MNQWCFSRQEMEVHSPSRRDGISLIVLSILLLSPPARLQAQTSSPQHSQGHHVLPPLLRASILRQERPAHRRYCLHFLAGKVNESPRTLSDVVSVAFGNQIQDQIINQMVHSTINLHDMRERDEFCREKGRVFRDQKKELIIAAERLVLRTIEFDLDVQLPYNKTLVAALKRLSKEKFTGFRLPELTKVAWCLVEEVLTTSLCLQYKPQYIAAGSVVVSASILKMKLPASDKWLEGLDVSPKELNEVIQRMQSKICRVNYV